MTAPTLRLTPEATAKLAALQACLAELGLTPDAARALLLAPGVCEDSGEYDSVDDQLGAYQEDAHSAWGDVLSEVGPFVEPV
jgi:hypothetical protein